MDKVCCVYIMASKRNGIIYTGVTSDLKVRTKQHKLGMVDGFSKAYNAKILVYYEVCGNMVSAIVREKQIKKWNRAWKTKLIEEKNPYWLDLYEKL